MDDELTICDIAERIALADREGAEKDIPEGARYIKISDTMAQRISDFLFKIAGRE